jgi:polysaccharide export outer membrane protein
VGLAGGLLDLQADPGSVFLYRREPRALAEQLGVDCSKFDGPTVPIVYSVSFKDPGGFFLATRFQMHNKDLLFAANAEKVEVNIFLALVQNINATANGITATGINVETWRIDSHTP